jgi:hypothetical protein
MDICIMDMTFGYKDHRDYENTPQHEGKECLGSMLPLMQSYYDTLQHRPARISSLKQNPDIGGNLSHEEPGKQGR